MKTPTRPTSADFVIEKKAETAIPERFWLYGVAFYVAVVAGAFVYKFFGQPVSSNAQEWGQLGDYIGGMLNPIVAFVALFLLARSIHIQRTELVDTKKALEAQAQSAELSATLAAYTSLINGIVAEGAFLQSHIAYLQTQLTVRSTGYVYDIDGGRQSGEYALLKIREVAHNLQKLRHRQAFYVGLIKVTLAEHGLHIEEPVRKDSREAPFENDKRGEVR